MKDLTFEEAIGLLERDNQRPASHLDLFRLQVRILRMKEEERPYREMLKQKKAAFKKLKRNLMEPLH